jgi:AbrB family looped-hinge helix DNA binding protein
LKYEIDIDGGCMTAVTVSPKFQIVIPKEICRKFGLLLGQKIQLVVYGNRIELISVIPAKRMRGALKGIDTRVPRQGDRA